MSLFSVVWLVVNYGFSVVGTRNLAAGKDAHFIGAEFGRHLKARASMAGLGVLIGTLGTTLSPMLRQMPVYGLLATLLGILGAFNLGWYFQGTQRFRTSVLLEIAGFAISLTLILTLVRGAGDGCVWVALPAGIKCRDNGRRLPDRSPASGFGVSALYRRLGPCYGIRPPCLCPTAHRA